MEANSSIWQAASLIHLFLELFPSPENHFSLTASFAQNFPLWLLLDVAYLRWCRRPSDRVTFPLHSFTCRLGHCLHDRMINWPIGRQGKGPCWGEEGGCMATGCKWCLKCLGSWFKSWRLTPPFLVSLLIIAELQPRVRMSIVLSMQGLQMSLSAPPFGSRPTEVYECEAFFSNCL